MDMLIPPQLLHVVFVAYLCFLLVLLVKILVHDRLSTVEKLLLILVAWTVPFFGPAIATYLLVKKSRDVSTTDH